MNRTTAQAQSQTKADPLPVSRILQRKCACGVHTMGESQCSSCMEKDQSLQRKNSSAAESSNLPMQRKLTIGASDDPMEKEADRIADQVMAMPANAAINRAPLRIQRFTAPSAGTIAEAPPSVERVLSSPGRPLEPELRQEMESRFGYDFSGVRIHAGQEAEQSAQDVRAQAYTVGDHIVFQAGKYRSGNPAERILIAHELTHVIQQEGGKRFLQRNPEPASPQEFNLVNDVERTFERALSRYRNWLTHNLILVLSDGLSSGDIAPLSAINSPFGLELTKSITADLWGLGGTLIGSEIIRGEQLIRLFFELRRASVITGIFGFISSAIIETIVSSLFDQTARIISHTAAQIANLVTSVINPAVDSELENLENIFQSLNDYMRQQLLNPEAWGDLNRALILAQDSANQAIPNIADESLYRQLALFAGVYSHRSVEAESEMPLTVSGHESPFTFNMANLIVETRRTIFNVDQDNSILIIRSTGMDCVNTVSDDEPSDDEPSTAQRHLLESDMRKTYSIQLKTYSDFSPIVQDRNFSISREFIVNETGYGIWYGVPRGSYWMRIYRPSSLPVGLCGEGSYQIIRPTS
jgi:hypothetical protein